MVSFLIGIPPYKINRVHDGNIGDWFIENFLVNGEKNIRAELNGSRNMHGVFNSHKYAPFRKVLYLI
jgi:hypothetical protein